MSVEVERPVRFIRLREIVGRIGVSRPAVYRLIKTGDFPRPIKIGRSSVWTELEVDEWVQKKLDGRNAGDGHK